MRRQLFESIKLSKPQTNALDLSHEKKLSCNMGDLVPIYLQEVIPGDKFRVTTELLLRLAPLVSPVMHRVNVFTHFFFVPNRLTYKEWPDFITGGEDGAQAPAFPFIPIGETFKTQLQPGSLADYLGIAPPPLSGIVQEINVSALPFRAYQMIYNEYYRDQNLTAKIPVTNNSTCAADEVAEILDLRKRAWEKDYFTSALPWAQRGGSVSLPSTVQYHDYAKIYAQGSGQTPIASGGAVSTVTGTPAVLNDGNEALKIENVSGIGLTINDLRRSARLQEWLEKNARGGSRYIESILVHFGVRSSDARLQRPEYLGGGKQPIVISEVLNTSATATEPQGNMAGHGVSVGNTNQFTKYFEEHGYIIGIMSILPRTAYQQGIPRKFTKFDKFDYFWPEFANIGEQEIKLQELYMPYTVAAGTTSRAKTFGYQSRYAEYKFEESTVHGDFKNTLSFWHMGRIFSNVPELNDSFTNSDPTHRVFAVTDTTKHKIYVQLYNNVKAIRPMPVFGTPQL